MDYRYNNPQLIIICGIRVKKRMDEEVNGLV
jgi:hypothetical protein